MKNNDLISRSALMKYIEDTHAYSGLPMAAHICTMELLTYAPAVEAIEVTHGQWIEKCRGKMCECIVCKEVFDNTCNDIVGRYGIGEWKYCPNCGAKMDLRK
jgi:hypothetical protein